MIYQKIKDLFSLSVEKIASDISKYAVNPKTDFIRNRKISPQKLISFLVSQGASSVKAEILDFWGLDSSAPSASALNQQRAKLKSDALEAVFKQFNSSVQSIKLPDLHKSKYRFLAADGSTCTYFSAPPFSSQYYYYSPGHSIKGAYSMHLNAFFDLETHTYTDALIQPVHHKNEFAAFCSIADRHDIQNGRKNVYIGDRGYCSYNNMAHVLEQGQYFLFRAKDIKSKGLVSNFISSDKQSFDIDVKVTLVRSHSKKISVTTDRFIRFIDKASNFDYIKYGSHDTYEMNFRIVRFIINNSSYECIVTNLPRDEFSVESIKNLYNLRWGIESSFRKLKYTIGLSSFHSYKSEYIKQEIRAKLIAYNITETMINHTILKTKNTKHEYKVNFTVATHICRVFLRPTTEKDRYDVMLLLQKELIPIRNGRKYSRLQTAHFRKPKYFIYRAA